MGVLVKVKAGESNQRNLTTNEHHVIARRRNKSKPVIRRGSIEWVPSCLTERVCLRRFTLDLNAEMRDCQRTSAHGKIGGALRPIHESADKGGFQAPRICSA